MAAARDGNLEWSRLLPIPNTVGVARAFAGVSGEALAVGGGANFLEAMPWDGGTKVWHADVFILESPECELRELGDWSVLDEVQGWINALRESLLVGEHNWIAGISAALGEIGIGAGNPPLPLQAR